VPWSLYAVQHGVFGYCGLNAIFVMWSEIHAFAGGLP